MQRIGILALYRAARNAPEEVSDIAKRELNRQINACGLENEPPPEVEKVRGWLREKR
ncbi:MAG TPA: hypothetical protein VGK24_00105 [Candidatus Angelobacter sp.]|jgi:hypothetical protein